jgi:protein LSM14
VPTTDFDFQGSNAKFDKAAVAPCKDADDVETNPSDDAKEKEKIYNLKSSFFDSLLSSTQGVQPSQGGRGGYRRRGTRPRRGAPPAIRC